MMTGQHHQYSCYGGGGSLLGRWWVSKEFANRHSSFSERKVLEAISEALEDRDLRENDRRPFPKVGPAHCNEALVRCGRAALWNLGSQFALRCELMI